MTCEICGAEWVEDEATTLIGEDFTVYLPTLVGFRCQVCGHMNRVDPDANLDPREFS